MYRVVYICIHRKLEINVYTYENKYTFFFPRNCLICIFRLSSIYLSTVFALTSSVEPTRKQKACLSSAHHSGRAD